MSTVVRTIPGVAFLLAAVVLAACGGDGNDEPEGPVARVTIQPDGTAPSSTQTTGPAAAAAVSPTSEPTPAPLVYVVQPGDTLSAICRTQVPATAEDSCVAQIVEMNGLANAGQIAAGQELLLPAAGGEPEPSLAGAPGTGSDGGTGAGGGAAQPAPSAGAGFSGNAVVTRVVDGDTIEVDIGGPVLVRLVGIDTPEGLAQPAVCYGPEASAYTKSLAEGQTVRLEIDTRDTDAEGRLMRYVYLPSGEMLNELLLLNGYGRVVVLPPDVRYLGRFLAAAQSARDSGLGIWSAC
jgi:micrococcal nuclease